MVDRTYEVRVTGLVPTQELLDELGDVEIAEHEIRTVLSARLPDQAALYGFLHRLRAFGLEVVEVRRLTGVEEAADVQGERR
ncbi:MAG TPA: hypothetical protein VF165_04650 [Nocardioidaceae bacterium]|jgi:hypothetical protein